MLKACLNGSQALVIMVKNNVQKDNDILTLKCSSGSCTTCLMLMSHENAACLLGDNDQDDAGFERNVCLSGVNSEREIHGRIFEYLCLSKRRSRCMIGATILSSVSGLSF
jgi:hypothetical protein